MNGLQCSRIIKGWSEKELAEKSGVTKATIRNVEEGKTNPSHTTRKKLAKALGIKEGDIFPAQEGKKKITKVHVIARLNRPDPDD